MSRRAARLEDRVRRLRDSGDDLGREAARLATRYMELAAADPSKADQALAQGEQVVGRAEDALRRRRPR